MLKDHEKFYAFCLLGGGIMLLALLAYFRPIPEGSSNLRIVDAALGGLLLAFGAAANALFRVMGGAETKNIGEAAANAMHNDTRPKPVTIEQPANAPIPVTETAADTGELPEDKKL